MFVNYLGFCLFQWMSIKSFKGLEPKTKFYTTGVRTLIAIGAGGVFVKGSTFCLCRRRDFKGSVLKKKKKKFRKPDKPDLSSYEYE